MRNVETIAQAFFDAAEAVASIAKVEFFTEFTLEDLKRVTRTPLLLISPHMMYLAYARHRQRGTQLLVNTFPDLPATAAGTQRGGSPGAYGCLGRSGCGGGQQRL